MQHLTVKRFLYNSNMLYKNSIYDIDKSNHITSYYMKYKQIYWYGDEHTVLFFMINDLLNDHCSK